MTKCPECGREFDPNVTHWLGCSQITSEPAALEPVPVPDLRTVEGCDFEGCDNPRWSDHARVKYCTIHKDPKSRKE